MDAMDDAARKAYIERIEADLAQTREDLAPLERGELRLAERKSAHESWRDTTDEMIAVHRRNIATFEAILAALRKRELP